MVELSAEADIFINMALSKAQKQEIVEDLKEKVERQKIMIFVDFTGLKVKDLFNLRKKLKIANGELKVAKKTLTKIVFKSAQLDLEPKKIPGQVCLVLGYKDVISPAKIIYQFSQENPNLKILGGFFEKKIREAGDIITLAQISSKEELLSELVRSINVPISNLVNVFQRNIKGLIYILANLK